MFLTIFVVFSTLDRDDPPISWPRRGGSHRSGGLRLYLQLATWQVVDDGINPKMDVYV